MKRGKMKKEFKTVIGGRELKVEVGEVAKQAAGSALVYYGDTVVLSAAVSKKTEVAQDFFPLMVLYQEKLYAAGKIPGGFLRREGRSSEHETLTSRLIDRPIRPLFQEGFGDEVQVINTVLSNDTDNSPEMTALIASSIALSISDIPFLGPIGGVQVGFINGEYIVNPTVKEKEESLIDLTVAGTREALNMVEAGAKQVSEDDMLGALLFGHAEIVKIVEFIDTIVKEVGVPKKEVLLYTIPEAVEKEVIAYAKENLIKAVSIFDKIERYQKIDEITENTIEHFKDKAFFKKIGSVEVFDFQAQADYLKAIKMICEHIVRDRLRDLITKDKIRPDGRGVSEIRPLSSRVSVLPRVHGSALFTRGQTQALGTVTLGSLKDNQIIDGIGLDESKRFMLHYNFPQFSVGEVGRYGTPGRREVGHGALGERALAQVIPSEDEFPYTIRVVSEILESNGSSSQATICAGTLALMNAGVPIKAPVAGIAMGLISDGQNYTILTDIQGMEDHEGDMDFKVAGTKNGITALQMDIKIKGINKQILKEALEQAKVARLEILDHMFTTLPAVAEELSLYAPKVEFFNINPDKIKDVIGSGGKVINSIVAEFNNVKIDIEQTGKVYVSHIDRAWAKKAADYIKNLTREAKVGEILEAKVVRIEAYGCFVELWPGTEGLVHISRLAEKRIEKVEEVCKLNDIIVVKVIEFNEKNQLVISRKDALRQFVGKTEQSSGKTEQTVDKPKKKYYNK
jgi:polyribonucleotide nucleotidyltransferase